MSKHYWHIYYVNERFNEQVAPVECRRYEIEEVDRLMEDICLLQDINCRINGYETWFSIALMNECDEIVMEKEFKYEGD